MEIWKDVVGWEGCYQVSSEGNVRKADGTPITQTIARNGYYYFQARHPERKRKCFKTNVQIARAFLGEPPPGHVCDHIDRDRTNNRVKNLRYVTCSFNSKNSNYWEKASNVVYAGATPRLKNKWRVYFNQDHKRYTFGSYKTKKAADRVAAYIRKLIISGKSVRKIKENNLHLNAML